MKNLYGISPKPAVRSPSHQGYLGYMTQKQLQQLNKYKKEQESDKDSFASGHSNKGRRMKLRHVITFESENLSFPIGRGSQIEQKKNHRKITEKKKQ